MKLDPITDTTNIKGCLGYVKVGLLGCDYQTLDTAAANNPSLVPVIISKTDHDGFIYGSEIYVTRSTVMVPTDIKIKDGDNVVITPDLRGNLEGFSRDRSYVVLKGEDQGSIWLRDNTGFVRCMSHIFFMVVPNPIKPPKPSTSTETNGYTPHPLDTWGVIGL